MFVIHLIVPLMLIACNVSLQNYESEVEDAVRFNIAYAKTVAFITDKFLEENVMSLIDFEKKLEELDDFHSIIIEKYSSVEQSNAYEIVLNHFMKDTKNETYIKFSKTLLAYYKDSNILLSDYNLIKSSKRENIWNFRELHTNLEFVFRYTLDDNLFSVFPLQNSMEDYMLKLLD